MILGHSMGEDVPLTLTERAAMRFVELANEDPRGKWLQTRFLRGQQKSLLGQVAIHLAPRLSVSLD